MTSTPLQALRRLAHSPSALSAPLPIAGLVCVLAGLAACNPGAVTGGGPGSGGEAGSPGGPRCVDADGDGYGTNCAAGSDCDDTDRNRHEGCVPGQSVVEATLDPTSAGSSGVKADATGGITIDSSAAPTASSSILWVANSQEGTVSKIDTRTLAELARYRTGPGPNPDPSRTTVGLDGDVVIANRGGGSATRIAADLSRCLDKNGNGTIETSTGKTDVKAWGQDECVLWNTTFPATSYPRAAAFDARRHAVGYGSATVWIGLHSQYEMRQLDANTGAELANVNVSPVMPYGAAIDKDGNVWARGGKLVKIDRNHQVTFYDESSCGYGLAIDPQGRIWTSGAGCVARFTPATAQWETLSIPGSSFLRGLAIDAAGSVWIADTNVGVHQVDANTLMLTHSIPIAGYSGIIGVAIDFDGKPWAIGQATSTAYKIDPATYQFQTVSTGMGPYTYSDMTGFQLRNASGERAGIYRHLFPGCGADTSFATLSYSATRPAGAALRFRARTAADQASLAAAPWVELGSDPGTTSPIDLKASLGAAATAAMLEVEVLLTSADPVNVPTLKSLSVAMSCQPGIL